MALQKWLFSVSGITLRNFNDMSDLLNTAMQDDYVSTSNFSGGNAQFIGGGDVSRDDLGRIKAALEAIAGQSITITALDDNDTRVQTRGERRGERRGENGDRRPR